MNENTVNAVGVLFLNIVSQKEGRHAVLQAEQTAASATTPAIPQSTTASSQHTSPKKRGKNAGGIGSSLAAVVQAMMAAALSRPLLVLFKFTTEISVGSAKGTFSLSVIETFLKVLR
jgi:hypothetical protein